MIFINCLNISDVNPELYKRFYGAASRERRQKADRYRCPEDAVRCILAEMLFRFSLKEACGYSGEVVIQYNECGKPFVKDLEHFAYNISHSGKWVAAAYVCCPGDERGNSPENEAQSDGKRHMSIGIDVERIRESADHEKLADRFFHESEREYISYAADGKEKARRFTEVWTLKESYVKYLGTGLSKNLNSFSVDGRTGLIRDASGKTVENVTARSYALGEDYYVSVCSNCEDEKVVIKFPGQQGMINLLTG